MQRSRLWVCREVWVSSLAFWPEIQRASPGFARESVLQPSMLRWESMFQPYTKIGSSMLQPWILMVNLMMPQPWISLGAQSSSLRVNLATPVSSIILRLGKNALAWDVAWKLVLQPLILVESRPQTMLRSWIPWPWIRSQSQSLGLRNSDVI